ncbi:hypothetical protein [Rhodovulum sp. PH10]|uniref:hypothetical protein n=1 Tax=Rhodovulum sp. PH10 TaxID=1187851 RepID=UPI00178C2E17|nr:hypothetical protein [Rhodovulum sp. PH10]
MMPIPSMLKPSHLAANLFKGTVFLVGGAFLATIIAGAGGVAWWLYSKAEETQEIQKYLNPVERFSQEKRKKLHERLSHKFGERVRVWGVFDNSKILSPLKTQIAARMLIAPDLEFFLQFKATGMQMGGSLAFVCGQKKNYLIVELTDIWEIFDSNRLDDPDKAMVKIMGYGGNGVEAKIVRIKELKTTFYFEDTIEKGRPKTITEDTHLPYIVVIKNDGKGSPPAVNGRYSNERYVAEFKFDTQMIDREDVCRMQREDK